MENKKTKNKNAKKNDYKIIVIDLDVTVDDLEELLGDLSEDDEEFKEYTKQLKMAKKLNGKRYKVSSLKEYFDLLETIDEITGGEYKIYNNGTYISDMYA